MQRNWVGSWYIQNFEQIWSYAGTRQLSCNRRISQLHDMESNNKNYYSEKGRIPMARKNNARWRVYHFRNIHTLCSKPYPACTLRYTINLISTFWLKISTFIISKFWSFKSRNFDISKIWTFSDLKSRNFQLFKVNN